MFGFITRLFGRGPVKADPKPFVRTGICPVCGHPAELRFTKGKGKPYESCSEHQIQSLLLKCHDEGHRVIGLRL